MLYYPQPSPAPPFFLQIGAKAWYAKRAPTYLSLNQFHDLIHRQPRRTAPSRKHRPHLGALGEEKVQSA
eukprot:42625-Amphidinium_carterae.1